MKRPSGCDKIARRLESNRVNDVSIFLLALACAEIISLVKLGQAIGAAPVLGVILLTAVLGLLLLRVVGRSALIHLARSGLTGRIAMKDLLRKELSLLLAGLFFIFPGLISDGAALILLGRYLLLRPGRMVARDRRSEDDVIDIDFRVSEEAESR